MNAAIARRCFGQISAIAAYSALSARWNVRRCRLGGNAAKVPRRFQSVWLIIGLRERDHVLLSPCGCEVAFPIKESAFNDDSGNLYPRNSDAGPFREIAIQRFDFETN